MLQNQRGQGLVEYVILLALVVIVCVTSSKTLGSTISGRLDQIEKKITSKIPVNINP